MFLKILKFSKGYLYGFLLTFLFPVPATPLTVNVSPNHNRIHFDGVLFVTKTDTLVKFVRITDAVINDSESKIEAGNAATQTGVVVRFRSASDTIRATFVKMGGQDRGVDFGIYQDGVLRTNSDTVSFDIIAYNPGKVVTYEIVLPSWCNVGFKGLKLATGDSLVTDNQPRKPRYVAIGNSITHGNGQGSASYKTYPFLLSRMAGWELVNLAIGASWVSPALGAMFPDAKPDIITILWGYNDWNKVNDLHVFKAKYEKLLTNIRNDHPKVPIYCITYIHHDKPADVDNGYSLNDFRTAVRDIVKARVSTGDTHLFVLNGENMTSAQDLIDGTHLNVAGAARLADSLYKHIGDALATQTKVKFPKKQMLHSPAQQSVYDVSGKRIQSRTVVNPADRLNATKSDGQKALPSGMYVQRSTVGHKANTRLIVIK